MLVNFLTKCVAIEQLLKIERFASVGMLVQVVDHKLTLLTKHIRGILAEGFDGKDVTRQLTLPLPMLSICTKDA